MSEDLARLLTNKPSLLHQAPLTLSLLALSRTLHGLVAEQLLTLGLYPGQELILMRLYDRDDQIQTTLQQSIGLDHSTLSRSIRRMQDAGLVTRRPDDRDRRAMIVSLTPAGRALQPRLAQIWEQLEELTVSALGHSGQDSLVPALESLERSLTAARRKS
ncbi:putative transcriptional regulator, MarR family protein [Actinoplanes sp. NBRC 14428]|uniref:DNA-binding MarR family transcriptional regulator n=1 Tax=Pseudosporangium ferrugineum TaxID=439699 RepID=A0A2T0S3Q2_9ACTN|nr:MarR family winged helix-turn-helix transcriptional regulator [Pseudosporangium ferrugineum]PRY28058.1 DNA-binding MarR family transcriptional regulator [Pseudosporangium ferrugineum]BCJ52182.1 putative transcriptional regulator, MarR family protein [Actinoplanes sp. NBRC 14428]